MQNVIAKGGSLELVTGAETVPENNSKDALDTYRHRRNRARATVVLADPGLLYLLSEDPNNLKDVWDAL